MTSLETFLVEQINKNKNKVSIEEEEFINTCDDENEDEYESDEDNIDDELKDMENAEITHDSKMRELTFGEQLNSNNLEHERYDWERFNRKMNNRSKNNSNSMKNGITDDMKSSEKTSALFSYANIEFNASVMNAKKTKNMPKEHKIYKWPLKKYKSDISSSVNKLEAIDPRFHSHLDQNSRSNMNGNGWQLRNAYKFLDSMIDRDIDITKNEIFKSKKKLKAIRKRNRNENRNENRNGNETEKIVRIETLKKELIQLRNKRNSIKERDLRQQTKSELRSNDIQKVRLGYKVPFYVKENFNKKSFMNKNKQMADAYLKKKYLQLKKDGTFEQYMKKKRKKINSKFRVALKKKSGRGWNN